MYVCVCMCVCVCVCATSEFFLSVITGTAHAIKPTVVLHLKINLATCTCSYSAI